MTDKATEGSRRKSSQFASMTDPRKKYTIFDELHFMCKFFGLKYSYSYSNFGFNVDGLLILSKKTFRSRNSWKTCDIEGDSMSFHRMEPTKEKVKELLTSKRELYFAQKQTDRQTVHH